MKSPNKVKEVMKLADGGLRVILHSGKGFILSKDDVDFQVFVIYTMLKD